ncbi:MAG: hypoxanthine phosphoribosyltransferase [Bacteroidales bacterium]|nr:hypoxanthine phosphoribosyltransferase [Bacteroidales bacterium]
MITIQGKQFRKYILQSEIQQIVGNLAQRINKDYKNRGDIVFIVILNGAFMFASDLFKNIEGLHKITFVKLTSYESVNSTGKVKSLIGLKEDITNKNVIIVEDIVDSGKTMGDLLQQLQEKNPRSLEICSLMFKPGNFKGNYNIKYIGKEISNEFIVGYGFDLDGLGRNLPDIYQLSE